MEVDSQNEVVMTAKKKRERTKSLIPVALSMTPPSSQISSEETAVEKVKREAEKAMALERARREESDYARMIEISVSRGTVKTRYVTNVLNNTTIITKSRNKANPDQLLL